MMMEKKTKQEAGQNTNYERRHSRKDTNNTRQKSDADNGKENRETRSRNRK